VRFLYARPQDWYLSITPGRDVIELPIENELDISGWDIRKALGLLLKANPALLEWLESPIVYRAEAWVHARLRELADRSHHRRAAAYHYLSLAGGQYRRSIAGRDRVTIKKYPYALRPVLALIWLRQNPAGRVPMALPHLLDSVDISRDVRHAIDALLEAKRRTRELGESSRRQVLDTFIERELDRAKADVMAIPPAPNAGLAEAADSLFREVVAME
jgi:hypothetical protein